MPIYLYIVQLLVHQSTTLLLTYHYDKQEHHYYTRSRSVYLVPMDAYIYIHIYTYIYDRELCAKPKTKSIAAATATTILHLRASSYHQQVQSISNYAITLLTYHISLMIDFSFAHFFFSLLFSFLVRGTRMLFFDRCDSTAALRLNRQFQKTIGLHH